MKSFNERCYSVLRKVPRGRVTTYREISHALNSKAYRAVGNAMNRNPYAPRVPCHRVINSNGFIGQFAIGIKEKIRLLRSEGVYIDDKGFINLKKYLFRFD